MSSLMKTGKLHNKTKKNYRTKTNEIDLRGKLEALEIMGVRNHIPCSTQ